MTAESSGTNKLSHEQKEEEEEEGRFLVATGAMIELAGTGRILLLKRSDNVAFLPGIWEDVGGRMKQFEEPEDTLRREVLEETGLEIEIIRPINVRHFFHGERSAENDLVIITYWCKSHSDAVALSHEHAEYRWLWPQEALPLVEHEGVKSDIELFMVEASRERAYQAYQTYRASETRERGHR